LRHAERPIDGDFGCWYRTYVRFFGTRMTISLTELRQQLFKLADQVVDTGVPLLIERHGVRLRLVREDAQAPIARLRKLKPQSLVQGAALAPDESPALWSESALPQVAEGAGSYAPAPAAKAVARKRRG
jgi:hypothetical protein